MLLHTTLLTPCNVWGKDKENIYKLYAFCIENLYFLT